MEEKLTVGKCFGVDHFSKFTGVLTYKISSTYTPTVQKEILIRENLANAVGLYPLLFCRAVTGIPNLEKGGIIMKITTASKMRWLSGDLIRCRYGKDSAVGVIARGRLDGIFEQK